MGRTLWKFAVTQFYKFLIVWQISRPTILLFQMKNSHYIEVYIHTWWVCSGAGIWLKILGIRKVCLKLDGVNIQRLGYVLICSITPGWSRGWSKNFLTLYRGFQICTNLGFTYIPLVWHWRVIYGPSLDKTEYVGTALHCSIEL